MPRLSAGFLLVICFLRCNIVQQHPCFFGGNYGGMWMQPRKYYPQTTGFYQLYERSYAHALDRYRYPNGQTS